MKSILILALLNLGFLFSLNAQPTLPVPRNVQAAIDNGTRSLSGQPGKSYWQNAAVYDLHINFTPATRVISGKVDIAYRNNSPDTLDQLHFKLYPNFYQKGAPRMSPIKPGDVGEGMTIETIAINQETVDAGKARISGTEMRLPIPQLLPHQEIQVTIEYNYKLNKDSHQRTGEVAPGAYFIAYFFPRITVYDDVDGWNRNRYLGTQEFYNDFCDFKAEITVPNGYVVWATGNLTNCDEVLTAPICQRLKLAESGDETVQVIEESDIEERSVTKDRPANTFRYEAKNVVDFVFATSNHYIWQSSSLVVDPQTGRRTRVDAVFNPKHKDYYRVLGDAKATIEAMSYRFPKWPFPYPHETVFDGLDQMEYPMMVNDVPIEDVAESIELTDHEVFHTMFPFYMGTNETKYGWMDEGWATIGEWLITPMIDSSIVDLYGVAGYEQSAGTELDLPIMTPTTQLSGLPLFTNSYPKPAMGYLFVKDLLGDELFTKALHHYIETWRGKHPLPLDFFNCMNAGAGRNLNWFWKAWFYD
ncbi:MAG: peptidase, partial [Bacteroidetes bacterium]